MSIILDGTTGISSIGTLTGVTSISSASANTPVVMQDSGSNTNTCRAWVNFNGTGTVAIRASFNVTSITDNGTGLYTVNFTNPMPDVNWSGVITAGGTAGALGSRGYEETTARTTSSWSILTSIITGGAANQGDAAWINVTIFR